MVVVVHYAVTRFQSVAKWFLGSLGDCKNVLADCQGVAKWFLGCLGGCWGVWVIVKVF